MNSIEHQVGQHGPLGGHGDPDEVIEATVLLSGECRAAAGCGEHVVFLAPSDEACVGVFVSTEDGVLPAGECVFDLSPALFGEIGLWVSPGWLVGDDKRPPDVSVFLERLHGPVALGLAEVKRAGLGWVFGVEDQEQAVVVEEVVIATSEPSVPVVVHWNVADVVVASTEEEGHFEPVDDRFELGPFESPLSRVFGIAFDEVTDGEDELGLHEVDLFDSPAEDTRPSASGSVGDDHKLKVFALVVELQVGPRVAVSGLDPDMFGQGAGLRCRTGHGGSCSEDECDGECQAEFFHGVCPNGGYGWVHRLDIVRRGRNRGRC